MALLRNRRESDVFRALLAGCASGEEACFIAMLLREIMDETRTEFKVQLNPTDQDDNAIASARGGVCPSNIAQDLTPERLRRVLLRSYAPASVVTDLKGTLRFVHGDTGR